MRDDYKNRDGYRSRRRRKKKSHGCFIFILAVIVLASLLIYGLYLALFKKEPEKPPYVPPQQQAAGEINTARAPAATAEKKTANTYDPLFGEAKYLIHIHKLHYKLELFEKGNAGPVKTYDIAVAKNPGDKKKTGDNRTPTSWGNAVDIPKSYTGARPGVSSKTVPFRVEEICDAGSWTHDFNDGKGVIEGAYGPWFISLDTGWDGIGIHGTHDPGSIRTNASEGCIRLKNKDISELKKILYTHNKGIGTRVIITEE